MGLLVIVPKTLFINNFLLLHLFFKIQKKYFLFKNKLKKCMPMPSHYLLLGDMTAYLLSFGLLRDGSVGGTGTGAGALACALLGGTMGAGRTDIEGLPAEADRADGVSSTKFRAN